MDLFVFTFHQDKTIYRALACLSPAEVDEYGLPVEAVLGQISALLPSMTPDQFEENAVFVANLHAVVQAVGPTLEDLQGEARSLGTGDLAVRDGRAGQVTGTVNPADIIGRFAVRRGEIVPESYRPNEAYRLLTDDGPLQLPPVVEEALLAAIREQVRAYK